MKSSFRIRAVAFVASAAVLALTACSAGSSTSGSGSGSSAGGDQKLSIGLVAEPASLDFTTTDGAAIPQALLGNVYETLVKQDDSGKIVPSLAKSWTVAPDRKTYTFDLVDNAKFTNGKQFTANDAVFSINRVKTAWTISLKAAMDVVAGAKALSPTQLQVTLAKPSNDWLFRMTTRIGAMFSESGVSALATDPVGTGPFKFSKWNRGDSIVMVRNDDYWGSKPFFQQITLKYFKDATALNNALLTSTINVIGTVQAPEALSQFTSNDKYQVIEGTTNGEVLLSFNNVAAGVQGRPDPPGDPDGDRPQGAAGHVLGRSRQADRQHGPADRPVVRGPHRHRAVRPGQGEGVAAGIRCGRQDAPAAAADVAVRNVLRPGGEEHAGAGRAQGAARPARVPGGLADHGLQERRLRHVDHRARRAA